MNTKVQHTPGPWHVEAEVMAGGPELMIRGGSDGEVFVAEVWGVETNGYHDPISKANAQLIAAAPDLLELARKIDSFREALIAQEYDPGSMTVTRLCDEARAAIAAATTYPRGETDARASTGEEVSDVG